MYYALVQLQLKLKGNSSLPVGNGAQEKLCLWFRSRYRHPLQASRQQNKGYRSSQAKVNRRVVYYGLYYGGSKTSFLERLSAIPEGALTLLVLDRCS